MISLKLMISRRMEANSLICLKSLNNKAKFDGDLLSRKVVFEASERCLFGVVFEYNAQKFDQK